jgi:hypothetical protein
MIYDVKHDGCHKSRLVRCGHLADPNTESVYSCVISLRFWANEVSMHSGEPISGMHTKKQEQKSNCISLEALNFGKLEGYSLLVDKALYGLRDSDSCWHQRLQMLKETYVSAHERHIKMFGCVKLMVYTSI